LEGSKDAPRDGQMNDWRKRQQKELDQLAQDNVNLRKEMEEKMNEHCNKLDELKQDITGSLEKKVMELFSMAIRQQGDINTEPFRRSQ
jgi:ABC-type Fe3+-citrate transport system substrate-binding protein